MPKSADTERVLQAISFSGQSLGTVKSLRGFKKGFHTLPDAVTAVTTAFVQRLAESEIAEEAEQRFQKAKTLLGYKRKELSLDIALGQAILSAKDFVFEIACALSEAEPSGYIMRRSLHSVRSIDFLRLPEAQNLFTGAFSDVIFTLKKGGQVEAVIDAIENLDTAETGLKVVYPSDCRECTISVEGVNAEVRFAGHEISVVSPRKASPQELWDGFLAVRQAFSLSKNEVLTGLVGSV